MTMAPERCARPGFEISMSPSSSSSPASSIPSSPTLIVSPHRRTLGLAKYSSFSFPSSPSSPILLTYLHHHQQGLIVQIISSLTSLSWPKSSTKPEKPCNPVTIHILMITSATVSNSASLSLFRASTRYPFTEEQADRASFKGWWHVYYF